MSHTPLISDSRRTLLVTSGVARLDDRRLQSFVDAGFRIVERYELASVQEEARIIAALDGVWAVLAGSEIYSRRVLASAPSLQAIVRLGVGHDAIDLEAARDHGVHVITTPGANDGAVAEFAVALILAAARAGDPDQSPSTADTSAVIGLGAIGLGVARRLRALGCRVLGVDPLADPAVCAALGVELCPLDSALARAGVVTIHTPLNVHTRGLIGAREMRLMSSDAILVNTSRGGIVDEVALAAALGDGSIRGAALDVFAVEPLPSDSPMRRCPTLVTTGHIAGISQGSVRAMLDQAAQALDDVRTGSRRPRGSLAEASSDRIPATPVR